MDKYTYSYCLNNPLKYSDPSGMLMKARDESDYAFVAYFGWMTNVAGSWHYSDFGGGGGGGGYHYDWKNEVYRNNIGEIATWNEVYFNYVVPFSYSVNDPGQFIKDFQKAYTSAFFGINDYDKMLIAGPGITLEDGPGWEAIKLLWNLKIIGGSIPDNISFDLNLGSVLGIGKSVTFSLNFLTRGDVGFYLTRTEQLRGGAEVDWGLNLNFGYYSGNSLDINKSSLLGPIRSVSFGYVQSLNGSFGYQDNSFGPPSWITIGTGVGLTGGVSYGWGRTYGSWTKY